MDTTVPTRQQPLGHLSPGAQSDESPRCRFTFLTSCVTTVASCCQHFRVTGSLIWKTKRVFHHNRPGSGVWFCSTNRKILRTFMENPRSDVQAERTFPNQPKATTRAMRDKEGNHTGLHCSGTQPCELLNQALPPCRC